ncbi:MAG: hypothetical protein JWQ40_408, partial [Segetibacter sp.]|nr:hypothetical protein [Segetibacter sp.]
GELGIRTPGGVTLNSFQDCRNRPLCQLSGAKVHFELYPPKKVLSFFIYSSTKPVKPFAAVGSSVTYF